MSLFRVTDPDFRVKCAVSDVHHSSQFGLTKKAFLRDSSRVNPCQASIPATCLISMAQAPRSGLPKLTSKVHLIWIHTLREKSMKSGLSFHIHCVIAFLPFNVYTEAPLSRCKCGRTVQPYACFGSLYHSLKSSDK